MIDDKSFFCTAGYLEIDSWFAFWPLVVCRRFHVKIYDSRG